ncbi:MAG: flagellar biosynthesis protein FlhB [Phycisphaerae bacterium]|nr:MAG: flagellar biosynthesis protein FlhB [Planctomycetia bacterium]RIK66138.1 MAG: flagellar biosynthesis protein FlhB [Planctomycetota bacterium]GJQ25627.1 MAG: flagellar biosynthesis protein FlhB [Phycisphaerae bacterium]
MADDRQDRTEAPTPRRRFEAREKGQVARSADLTSALLLLGGLVSLKLFGPRLMTALMDFMSAQLTMHDPATAARLDMPVLLAAIGMTLLVAVGPIMLGLVVVAALSNLVQVGILVSSTALAPNVSRLNPISGFGKLFSGRTGMQLVMNLLKLLVVSYFVYQAAMDHSGRILMAMAVGGWEQLGLLADVLYDLGLRIAIVLVVLALLDYAYQRRKFEADLRMTKHEVKEEMRSMEGDPIIKSRRRKMQFVALMQQIRKAVPTADVVVTNPTELAVAIQYDQKSMAAPKVVAKGADLIAAKIREVAIASGVPILERKPLAQALYKMVEVGQEIPEQFYKAIAEVLAYVYELSGKARSMRRGTAA